MVGAGAVVAHDVDQTGVLLGEVVRQADDPVDHSLDPLGGASGAYPVHRDGDDVDPELLGHLRADVGGAVPYDPGDAHGHDDDAPLALRRLQTDQVPELPRTAEHGCGVVQVGAGHEAPDALAVPVEVAMVRAGVPVAGHHVRAADRSVDDYVDPADASGVCHRAHAGAGLEGPAVVDGVSNPAVLQGLVAGEGDALGHHVHGVLVERMGVPQQLRVGRFADDVLRYPPQRFGCLGAGAALGQRDAFRLRFGEQAVAGDDRDYGEADAVGEVLHVFDLVLHPAAVQDDPSHAGASVVVVQQTLEDVVRSVEGHELAGCDDVDSVGVAFPQRDGESSADDVAEDIVDLVVGVRVVEPGGVQEVEHRQDPASGAPHAGFGAACFYAADAGRAFEHDVVELAVLLGSGAEVVEDRPLGPPLQEEPGRVMLRVAADLHDPVAHG